MKRLIPFAFQIGSKIAPNWAANIALDLFLKPARTPRAKKEVVMWNSGEAFTFRSGRVARLYTPTSDVKHDAPLLFFVHGWEGRGSQWYRFVAPALAKGFRVLLWDGPAHGDSPGEKANVILFARSIVEDLNELGSIPYAMIGHSMGGAAVGLLPQFSVFVPRVITVASPTLIQGVFDRYFDTIRLQAQSRAKVIHLMKVETRFSVENASLLNSPFSEEQKVLVIHDENDKEIPFSDFVQMKNARPSISFIATQGLGHRRILYSNETVNHVIDFVSRE